MKDLPTAEEFIEQYLRGDRVHDDINKVVDEEEAIEAMIEFAKLHVAAALKEASEKISDKKGKYIMPNKEFILISYSLENIK
jgi:hypothetical protein